MSQPKNMFTQFFPSNNQRNFLKAAFVAVAVLMTRPAVADIVSRDTTSPNTFWFSSEVYYVEEGATNAVIAVEFSPGNRSWSGSVNFNTSDGTATAGQDYTQVSGTMNFSGPGAPVPQIVIPIAKNSLRAGDKTVQISLSNPNALITRSNATLVIVAKPPALKIHPGGAGTVAVSWPSANSDFTLEKSSQPLGGTWTEVSSPRNISNGDCSVSEQCSPTMVFYRLRKIITP